MTDVVDLHAVRGQTPETEDQAKRRQEAHYVQMKALTEPLDTWAKEQLLRYDLPPWERYNVMFLRDAISRVVGPAPDEIPVNLP